MRAFDKHNAGRDGSFRRWVVVLRCGKRSDSVVVSATSADDAIGVALSQRQIGSRKDATARLAGIGV